MIILNKLNIKVDKKILYFLITLLIIGISAGSLFSILINDLDKELVNNHIINFLNLIKEGKQNYILLFNNEFFSNFFFILFIWILGISVIGLPIIIILFFSKCFSLGFIIGSIITKLKIGGIVFSFIYVFPGQIFLIILYLLLMMYSMSFSMKLLYTIFYKKSINFKGVINIYLKILFFCLIGILIITLWNTFILTRILKFFISNILI